MTPLEERREAWLRAVFDIVYAEPRLDPTEKLVLLGVALGEVRPAGPRTFDELARNTDSSFADLDRTLAALIRRGFVSPLPAAPLGGVRLDARVFGEVPT